MRSIPGFLFAILLGFAACHSSKKSSKSKITTLEGTYWKLIVLGGRPVTSPRDGVKEIFLQIKAEDSTVSGNGGCNGFGGNYRLEEGEKIKFSKLVSTMMACNGMETENAFFKALENADGYYIKKDTLQLNRSKMAPLARFIAVKDK